MYFQRAISSLLFCLLASTIVGCASTQNNEEVQKKMKPKVKTKKTELSGSGFYEFPLQKTKPRLIEKRKVKISGIKKLKKPRLVDLKEMSIDDHTFNNMTPYLVKGVFVKARGDIKYIKFNKPVPKYSSAQMDVSGKGFKLIEMRRIGNNILDFKAPFSQQSQSNKVRHVTSEERDSAERVQMYERYFVNEPSTLSKIKKRVNKHCKTSEWYSLCKAYPKSPSAYANDMYYAQSSSGKTIRLYITPDVWGMGEMPELSLSKSTAPISVNLWMNPNLMSKMLSAEVVDAVDAEQGFIHEYYHNLGFAHESGWPSVDGIDDLFGDLAVKSYRKKLKNRYTPSNLVVSLTKSDPRNYTFQISRRAKSPELKMRLLSTHKYSGELIEKGTDQVTLRLDKAPTNDIYVSFYSSQSEQMATVILEGSGR